MPPAEALELGVDDVDGPTARLLGHAAEERDDVGAPALEVLLDVARRGLADPWRAVWEVPGPDGDVVPSHGGCDVDLRGRGEVSVRVRKVVPGGSGRRIRTNWPPLIGTTMTCWETPRSQASARVRQLQLDRSRTRTLLGPTKHAGRCPSVVPNPAP